MSTPGPNPEPDQSHTQPTPAPTTKAPHFSPPPGPCATVCSARQGRHQVQASHLRGVVRRQEHRAPKVQQRQGNEPQRAQMPCSRAVARAAHTQHTRAFEPFHLHPHASLASPNLLGGHAGFVTPARPRQRRAHAGCGAQAPRPREGTPSVILLKLDLSPHRYQPTAITFP